MRQADSGVPHAAFNLNSLDASRFFNHDLHAGHREVLTAGAHDVKHQNLGEKGWPQKREHLKKR